MAHTNITPMTNEQRLDYARRLRIFAERMRREGDLYSAEINDWMADNYSKPEGLTFMDRSDNG